MMNGYWEEPSKTAEVIDNHRWLRTGDIASMVLKLPFMIVLLL